MVFSFSNTKRMNSSFIKEDYFPLIIEFSSKELNNRFIELNYEDTDMLEIVVNASTFEIKRCVLAMCKHYSIEEGNMSTPECNEVSLSIKGPDKSECSTFNVLVFNDGVQINTSPEKALKYLKCGQLIFGITSSNDISSIYVTELTSDNIAHVKTELLATS